MKNATLVSRISNDLKAINKDVRLSKRYILQVAIDKSIFLMAQKFRDRSLFRESNLYRTLECFDLVKVDKYSCGIVEFKTCHTVMKSVKPLPPLIYFRYGSSLKEVTNIDFSLDFKPTTPSKYRRDKRRQEFKNDHFFMIKDNHLFLPDSDVQTVALYLYTPNAYELEKASACNKNECLNPWEFDFICSDKLVEVVIQETIKEISLRLQIIEDENPNLDSNQPSKTTN